MILILVICIIKAFDSECNHNVIISDLRGDIINIERFIEVRKQRGLVQSELAEGICTQATLSRFENNGHVPSLKILIKLCNRLELPLSELFPKVGVKHSKLKELMEEAEFSLILSEYEKAGNLLENIDLTLIDNSELTMRYHYLKAFVMIYNKHSTIDTLYELDQILLDNHINQHELYKLLAYTGSGIIFKQLDELEKAEFYFAKVLDRIYDFPTNHMEEVWRVLHIVFECSKFYAHIDEIDISNALAEHAISICSDNHVTYYLARAAIQLAKNAMTVKESKDTILALIYDARAYSKINRNKIALKELDEMEKYIKNEY